MNKSYSHYLFILGVWSLLFVMSFSFPFHLLPNVGAVGEVIWNHLIELVGWNFNYHSGEDSAGVVMVLILSLFFAVTLYLVFRKFKPTLFAHCTPYFLVLLRYYLALILLIYGIDKLFGVQFYAPESNILYTPIKDVPKDLLYWTVMGQSPIYEFFAGVVEVIPAMLLLFRRTTGLGALIALAVFFNVFMTNIGFDITIKIFSGFLTLISFMLSLPYLGQISVFIRGKSVQMDLRTPKYVRWKYYKLIKVTVILLIVLEVFSKFVWLSHKQYSLGDQYFRGAFEVIETNVPDIERVHFHKDGYFIIETNTADFYDFQLRIDTVQTLMQLRDYNNNFSNLSYSYCADTLVIQGQIESDSVFFKCIKIGPLKM